MSRILLNLGLKAEYGIENDEIIRSGFGKPSLKNNRKIHIGITHCRNAVSVIISENPVGIDMEKVRAIDMNAARRVLCEEELRELAESESREEKFFRYWTLKESYIKALGCGFSYPVKKLRFCLKDEEITSNKPFAVFHILSGHTGFITSVCHLGSDMDLEKDMLENILTIP